MTIIYALIMFCLLIFVHEFGHLIAAKKCDVKVNEFALGMGPAIWKKQKGDTLYSLRVFPIGGYCAMEGEDEDSDDERAFNKKKPYQKAIIVCAGSVMNLIAAILIMCIISFAVGTATTTIGEVMKDTPAAAAGLEEGDRLVSVDGEPVDQWEDLSAILAETDKDTVSVTVMRNGEEVVMDCGITEEDGRKIIGVRTQVEHDLIGAIGDGFTQTGELAGSMFVVLKQLVTGEVSTDNLTGPVGIVYMVNESVDMGMMYLLFLTALISLNLAIFNMLPFPALDGGRLVFIVIRKITGKAITDRIEAGVHMAGMAVLLILMVAVTWNDIVRFIVPIFN